MWGGGEGEERGRGGEKERGGRKYQREEKEVESERNVEPINERGEGGGIKTGVDGGIRILEEKNGIKPKRGG